MKLGDHERVGHLCGWINSEKWYYTFSRVMAHVESRCASIWTASQFWGRVKARRVLPNDLEEANLFAIVAVLLPEADEATRMLLVAHALRSQGYVAAIEAGATRARFFAVQVGRAVDFEDVERVMIECGTDKPVGQPPQSLPATPPPKSRGSAAKPVRKSSGRPPMSHRQPLGAFPGPNNFTGTRPPGLLP